MSLTLYFHPLASFCHKVLIALYEGGIAFDGRIVDLGNEASSAELLSHWPVGKIPLLRDEARGRTLPETSIIIEYLAQWYPGAAPLLPQDPELALQVRLWDRFFDLYVSVPMQKVVTDRLRPSGSHDPLGVEDARATLRRAYGVLEQHLQGRVWAAGETFSMADCSAAPALFYADIVEPFSKTHRTIAAYFERLLERPSVSRTLEEARPYFPLFPLRDAIPARFTSGRQ
jgi:glutathione S-transferase